jgi:hypothetical protein
MTNSYNLIDAAVKTIRNLIGRVSEFNPNAFTDNVLIQKIIIVYNNTVHRAFKEKFTPNDVQTDRNLELEYIKWCKIKLDQAEQKRLYGGLLDYQPGNILLIHLPLEKTKLKYNKRRRNFDELATFITYEGGNAVVDLLHPYPKLKRVTIPLFYTRFLATDIKEYGQKYNRMFAEND